MRSLSKVHSFNFVCADTTIVIDAAINIVIPLRYESSFSQDVYWDRMATNYYASVQCLPSCCFLSVPPGERSVVNSSLLREEGPAWEMRAKALSRNEQGSLWAQCVRRGKHWTGPETSQSSKSAQDSAFFPIIPQGFSVLIPGLWLYHLVLILAT